jgi:hypothetical protein
MACLGDTTRRPSLSEEGLHKQILQDRAVFSDRLCIFSRSRASVHRGGYRVAEASCLQVPADLKNEELVASSMITCSEALRRQECPWAELLLI